MGLLVRKLYVRVLTVVLELNRKLGFPLFLKAKEVNPHIKVLEALPVSIPILKVVLEVPVWII